MNWIDDYKTEFKKLPKVPDWLRPVLEFPADEISPELKITNSSGQYWAGLTGKRKTQLLELIDWLGGDSEDYLEQMRVMLPKMPTIRR